MFSLQSLALALLVLVLQLLTAVGKPNVIVFVIDDLGWNDTGYQGAGYTTPNLDRLATEGVRLQQYYVQPLCTPSRAALMAGRYPYNLQLAHGVIGDGCPYGLNLSETTVADQMRKAGYATHAVGKWHLGMCKWEYTPTYRGFDSFYGYYSAAEDYFTHECSGTYRSSTNPSHFVQVMGVDMHYNTKPVTDKNGVYSTNLFSEKIQEILTNHDPNGKPFFIYAAYQSVHEPLQVPDSYKEKCSSIPESIYNRTTFCGMMKALDEGIGNVTDTLKEKGYLDNTIIILTTDNGGQTARGSSNLPLRGGKVTVFEGGVRGISFVWGKDLAKKNYDNTRLMHITDWYRTIVEGVAGMPLDQKEVEHLDGYNMWDVINNDTPSPRNEILLQLDPPSDAYPKGHFIGQAAIRVDDWKLILGQPNCSMFGGKAFPDGCASGWVYLNGTMDLPPPNPSLTWLFDVIKDPTEHNNVADKFPEVVSMLKKKIEGYNSTHLVQLYKHIDPASNPTKYNGVWTPWEN